jgi:hypothetical protein
METETLDVIRLEAHPACQCMTDSIDHAAGKCWRDATETCQVCGRQVCSGCVTYYSPHVCVDCFAEGRK